MIRCMRTVLGVCGWAVFSGGGAGAQPPASFLAAKTFFQTNVAYDPRVAIATDAVVVHRHGDPPGSLRKAIGSWKERGYCVGRMFFADSDATNVYWTGRWDGLPHPDEVERDARGEIVKCAGVRPYMLPTEGWIRHLEEMAVQSVNAGADAVLPEEPLAHLRTGYEKAFAPLWVGRYGRPWEPESASAEARFLTGQLKNELYVELERRVGRATLRRARELGRQAAFIVPVHGVYSNVASGLVAPLGTARAIEEAQGYVGQVWTGPVNWCLAHYDSPEKSFFASAYALYDYFAELTAGGSKALWLLADPVEDDPNHKWPEFEEWYRHCVVAQLLFPGVSRFEVMPWPDRIFLPGYSTGGGTPAPERFRIVVLSAVQALQDVPDGGTWVTEHVRARIGVAVGDPIMWEEQPAPRLQATYGMLLPLIGAGVPVAACVSERATEAGYLSRFQVIVVSYEAWKPAGPDFHDALARWVRDGGSLVLLGADDDLGGAELWWRKAGQASPLRHLLAQLGLAFEPDFDRVVGRGAVMRRSVSPRRFGDPEAVRREYVPVLESALRRRGVPGGLSTAGAFCLRRGPYVVAHAGAQPLELAGRFIDVLAPELPLLDGIRLERDASGLYRDVTPIMNPVGGEPGPPCVLHTTHRLMRQSCEGGVLELAIRGPAGTPGVARVFTGGRGVEQVAAGVEDGRSLPVRYQVEGPTLVVTFPNEPSGARLTLRFQSGPTGRRGSGPIPRGG